MGLREKELIGELKRQCARLQDELAAAQAQATEAKHEAAGFKSGLAHSQQLIDDLRKSLKLAQDELATEQSRQLIEDQQFIDGLRKSLKDLEERDWEAQSPPQDSSIRPFQVRIRGVPHRLLSVPIPGLAGYVKTEVGEVYLCLLGVDDGALVLVADGEPPRLLVRGKITLLNGLELQPEEAPAITVSTPDSCGRNEVAAADMGLREKELIGELRRQCARLQDELAATQAEVTEAKDEAAAVKSELAQLWELNDQRKSLILAQNELATMLRKSLEELAAAQSRQLMDRLRKSLQDLEEPD